jgi:hypothetical protein
MYFNQQIYYYYISKKKNFIYFVSDIFVEIIRIATTTTKSAV